MPEVTAWKRLQVGTSERGQDDQLRTFVITETGLPGWVADQTIQRKYRKKTPIKFLPQPDAKSDRRDEASEGQKDGHGQGSLAETSTQGRQGQEKKKGKAKA